MRMCVVKYQPLRQAHCPPFSAPPRVGRFCPVPELLFMRAAIALAASIAACTLSDCLCGGGSFGSGGAHCACACGAWYAWGIFCPWLEGPACADSLHTIDKELLESRVLRRINSIVMGLDKLSLNSENWRWRYWSNWRVQPWLRKLTTKVLESRVLTRCWNSWIAKDAVSIIVSRAKSSGYLISSLRSLHCCETCSTVDWAKNMYALAAHIQSWSMATACQSVWNVCCSTLRPHLPHHKAVHMNKYVIVARQW